MRHSDPHTRRQEPTEFARVVEARRFDAHLLPIAPTGLVFAHSTVLRI
ncbi:hypothetical protein [Rathayibacter rathayi]|nr:hypothetical protein [Rathayibacter rathayi]